MWMPLRRTDRPITPANASSTREKQNTQTSWRRSDLHLDELSVILLRFVTIWLVELGSVIFLCWRRVLFVAAQGFNAQRQFEAKG